MSDVAELDERVERARREALELTAQLAEALTRALEALELLVSNEDGTPLEWPLPKDVVKERVQLAAFVETVKLMRPDRQQAFREVYAVEITKARQTSGFYSIAELSTVPVLPETKRSAVELTLMIEDVRRAVAFDRELADAVRVLTGRRWALAPDPPPT